MKALKDKVNVDAPGGAYPYGKLRNNPGDSSGTPVDEELMNDVMQLMEVIMNDAGIIANGQPDNLANSFQLWSAFKAAVRNRQASLTELGTAELATNAEVVTGTDIERIVTPAALKNLLDTTIKAQWGDDTDITHWTADGSNFQRPTAAAVRTKTNGKTLQILVSAEKATTTNGTALAFKYTFPTGATTTVWGNGIEHILPCTLYNVTDNVFTPGLVSIGTLAGVFYMNFNLITNAAFGNSKNIKIYANLTINID